MPIFRRKACASINLIKILVFSTVGPDPPSRRYQTLCRGSPFTSLPTSSSSPRSSTQPTWPTSSTRSVPSSHAVSRQVAVWCHSERGSQAATHCLLRPLARHPRILGACGPRRRTFQGARVRFANVPASRRHPAVECAG